MTSTATSVRGRGRPREFDESAVLDAVMELFWEQGFEAASLAEIVDAAGLNKSSLYNTFGSKEALFRRALDRYICGRQEMLDAVTSGGQGIDDLLALVDMVRTETLSERGRRGCLALNSAAELGFESDEVVVFAQRFRDNMREGIRRPLERAAGLGEIDGGLVDVYVDTTMSFMITVALSARSGAPEQELRHHLDSLSRLIDTWRTS